MGERRLAVVGGASWAGLAVGTGYGMTLASLPLSWIACWAVFTCALTVALLAGIVPRIGRIPFRGAWFVRGALSTFVLGLLIAWPVHRSLRPAAAQNWADLLRSSSSCGTSRRCYIQLTGYTAATGAPVQGLYRIVDQREGGLVVDMGDEHWWVSPEPSTAVHNHVLPSHYKLTLGDRMLTRTISLNASGLLVPEVGTGIWDALDGAPDPLSIGPEYRWDVGDVRINGELRLKSPVNPNDFVGNPRMRLEGNRLLLDYATFGDLANSRVKPVVQSSELSVTLPWAIPEPNLKVNRDMTILREWARQ